MNIRWMSPLDPDKTEIGRYTQALLPALHEAFALQVVTDSMTEHQEFDPEHAVKGMEPLNLYNIGNSYLHCGIIELAMQQPGIVILHDVSLLELGLAYARGNEDPDLDKLAGREYGADASLAFSALYTGKNYDWCGQSQQQYDEFVTRFPLFETFIGKPRGVVVHSDYALNWVREKYTGPVVRLDLPYAAQPLTAERVELQAPYTIVFCGHAGPNRRLRQFIEAWGTISAPQTFRLQLYGNIDKADEILALAEAAGLSGLIEVVGFVSDEALDEAIASADLALNLRNPTMGEASASQLRYWSKGVASIVSDVGWYGELPDDVVIKVSPEREHDDIAAALEALCEEPSALFRCGPLGNRYLVEQHSIERYVERLKAFVGEVLEARFAASLFDERLIPLMASMCDDVNDSSMFEATLTSLSGMVEGLEKITFNEAIDRRVDTL